MPVGQQFNLAVVMFHQGRTILHPIAAVIIGCFPNLANDGAVDMAAEHALDIEPSGITNNRIFVGADKADRVLDPLLDRLAQRPVTQAENPPDRVHKRVKREQKLVTEIAQKREPFGVLHHGVELMTMEDEKAASVGGDMDCMLLDRDRAIRSEMTREEFVVIARDVDNPGSLPRFAQNFLDDVVVLLRPVNPAPEGPNINEVTDNVERVELVLLQEIEKRVRAAATGAQMNV